MKRILTILFFLLGVIPNLHATHINGGYITYRDLGGNNYEIKLIIYRDCFNGVPPFDYPASLGVFDANNNLYTEILMYNTDSVYLPPPVSCIPPSGICFVRCIYTETIYLPPSPGVYTLAYQRCCRTQVILNLETPASHGMTFLTQINTNISNSSPDFISEIPGYTYVGDNFIYNASAMDADGDSLSYELSDCYDGADQLNPQPQPPYNPPYNYSPWAGAFSVQDVLGGLVPLTIDPVTGVMTATPGSLGIFQVAMKINEFRNGNLIGTQRREFLMFVSPASYFQLSGNSTANNGSQSLDIGDAWLIRKNMYDSTLYAIDTNAISNGAYIFPNPINGLYLVKASADSTSAFFTNNMPTYYGDQLFWYNATEVGLCMVNASNIDINLIQGVNPGGPGFVGGYISQGANKMTNVGDPLNGITVFLLDGNYNPVAYGKTDLNGFFSISNLPYGTYKVLVDKLNFINDPVNYPTVNINSSNPVLNNLDFLLHSDYLELVGSTGISVIGIPENNLTIQPNPLNKLSTLKYFLSENAVVSFSLFDITGRVIFHKENNLQEKGRHEIMFNEFTGDLGKGVYVLSVKLGNQKYNLKLIVAE